jgi:peroxiredoxin
MQTRQNALAWLTGAALLVAAGLAVGMAPYEEKPSDEKKPAQAKLGEAAPDFELKDLEGKTHKLSDYSDKIVVLEWFNMQCPFVKAAADMFSKTAKKYTDGEDAKVVWLAIDSTNKDHGDYRDADQINAYLKANDIDYAVLKDPTSEVGKQYNARTTPHMYIIHKGKLVYIGGHADGRGVAPGSRNYIAETLDALLAGQDVPMERTRNRGCSVKYSG